MGDCVILFVSLVLLLGGVIGQNNQCDRGLFGGDGLFGEYYADPHLSGPVAKSQVDPMIDLEWVTTPILEGETKGRCCSARWSGTITPELDGMYIFRVFADGGFRLWIDKKLVLNAWAVQKNDWPQIQETKVMMLAERSVSIQLTYTTGYLSSIDRNQNMFPKGPFLRLRWLQPGRGWAYIPSRVLAPEEPGALPAPRQNAGGLMGVYFPNIMLVGPDISRTRVDRLIDFNWNKNAPMKSLSQHTFSARWTGKIRPPMTGKYTFFLKSDNGVRLFVDNMLLIDEWDARPNEFRETTPDALMAGVDYPIVIEYYQFAGSSYLRFYWELSGCLRKELVPETALIPEIADSAVNSNEASTVSVLKKNGLRAQLYPNVDLSGDATIVYVNNVDYDWKGQQPWSQYPQIPAKEFSARFSGAIEGAVDGLHTFWITSDDGHRFWVNNQLLSDTWNKWGDNTAQVVISLRRGFLYPIRLEYMQGHDSSKLKLEWAWGSRSREVIPNSRFTVSTPMGVIINGDGLSAEYFPNSMLAPDLVAYKGKVSVLNFAYMPGEVPFQGFPSASYWTARFTGMLYPLYTEEYTIYVSSNDGTRVWIGNSDSPIIDDWKYHRLLETSGKVTLTAKQMTYFKLEWLHGQGSAALKLEWQSATQRREVIPQAVLSSVVGNPPRLTVQPTPSSRPTQTPSSPPRSVQPTPTSRATLTPSAPPRSVQPTPTPKATQLPSSSPRTVQPTPSPRYSQSPSPTTSPPTPQPTQKPSSPPNNLGRWDNYTQWSLIATAMVNLPDGKVLGFAAQRADDYYYYERDAKTFATIYDPRTGSFQNVDQVGHDMYCAALTLLPDGRLFAGGGGNQENSKRVSIFDPFTKTWQRGPDLAFGHWYGTAVVTADSSVFVVLGSETSQMRNVGPTTPEISQGNDFTKPFRQLYGIDMGGKSPIHRFYPFIHLAPNGKLFETGTQDNMYEIDPQAKTITLKGKRVPGPWAEGDSWGACYVMYDEAKVLALSGISYFGSPQAKTFQRVWSIDISGTGESGNVYVGKKVADMLLVRAFINAVTLPNGHVLAIGGHANNHDFDDTDSRLQPEIWDPYGSADGTGKWTLLAPMKKPRNYHSTAVLLQDGSVLAAGGGLCGQRCQVNHQDSEIFYPPYLFKADGSWAPRPVIANAPKEVFPSGIYTLKITGAGFDRIARVSVIHHGSVTHSISTDHRQLKVPIIDSSKSASGEYKIQLHHNYNVLTPGYWYLFVLNDAGTPSVAVNIKVNYPI